MAPTTVREMRDILASIPEDKQDLPLLVDCCAMRPGANAHPVTGGFHAGTVTVSLVVDASMDEIDFLIDPFDEDGAFDPEDGPIFDLPPILVDSECGEPGLVIDSAGRERPQF